MSAESKQTMTHHKQGIGGGFLEVEFNVDAATKCRDIKKLTVTLLLWQKTDVDTSNALSVGVNISNPTIEIPVEDTPQFNQWLTRLVSSPSLTRTLSLLDERGLGDW
jgi:hypothetical protein